MKVVGVIPARMASSRYPGKPLTLISGLPMVVHVYLRASMCETLSDLYVSTPDPEVREVAARYGAQVVMTSPDHERATDRVAETVAAVGASSEIVVNIQGDEPMLYPELVDAPVRALLDDPTLPCANPVARIHDMETLQNRNVIKVVMNQQGSVLYMSREPIPSAVHNEIKVPRFMQLLAIPFRRSFLMTYTALPQTPLERAESVDMLRVLEHGYRIKAVEVPQATISVDEPGDVPRVEQALLSDPLFARYRDVRPVP